VINNGNFSKRHNVISSIDDRPGKDCKVSRRADEEIQTTGLNSAKLKVKKIMSKPLVTVAVNDDVLDAVRKMKKINVHRLPVVDSGKVVGIISLSDIAKTSPEIADLLEYRLKMKDEEPTIKKETTAGICDSCELHSEKLVNLNGQWLCEDCVNDSEEE